MRFTLISDSINSEDADLFQGYVLKISEKEMELKRQRRWFQRGEHLNAFIFGKYLYLQVLLFSKSNTCVLGAITTEA